MSLVFVALSLSMFGLYRASVAAILDLETGRDGRKQGIGRRLGRAWSSVLR